MFFDPFILTVPFAFTPLPTGPLERDTGSGRILSRHSAVVRKAADNMNMPIALMFMIQPPASHLAIIRHLRYLLKNA